MKKSEIKRFLYSLGEVSLKKMEEVYLNLELDPYIKYMGIIYLYRNTISFKVYPGQTKNCLARLRDFMNIKKSYGGKYIDNARRKYSMKSWTVKVLNVIFEDDENKLTEKLDRIETRRIIEYKACDRNFGYNISLGGEHGPSLPRTKFPKISEIGKFIIHSLEVFNPIELQSHGCFRITTEKDLSKTVEYFETLDMAYNLSENGYEKTKRWISTGTNGYIDETSVKKSKDKIIKLLDSSKISYIYENY